MTTPTRSSSADDGGTAGRRWLAVVLWAVMVVLAVAGDAIRVAHQVRSPCTLWLRDGRGATR